MRKLLMVLTLFLVIPVLVLAQQKAVRKSTHVILADYSARETHCKEEPADTLNCETLQTANGGSIVLTKVCPEASDSEQSRLMVVADNMLTLEGMSHDNFEKMGWCKLSADEAGNLIKWHWSRLPTRVYYGMHRRAARRIYVRLDFDDDTPDTAKSIFRSALRAIGDVELVDSSDCDFLLHVTSHAVKDANHAGNLLGYVASVQALTLEDKPNFSGRETAVIYGSSFLSTCDPESLESCTRETVAKIDNHWFEGFRKAWPYIPREK